MVMQTLVASYPRSALVGIVLVVLLVFTTTWASSGRTGVTGIGFAKGSGSSVEPDVGSSWDWPSMLPSQQKSACDRTRGEGFSTFVYDPSSTLSYRDHLERTTSPLTQITHSPTLTFSRIYVLSLPTRKDRRARMRKVADALGLQIEFVDATSKDEPFIRWIAERAVQVRAAKRDILARARRMDPKAVGGLGSSSPWLARTLDAAGKVPLPTLPASLLFASSGRPDNWVVYLEQHASEDRLDELQPSDPHLNVTSVLWDDVEYVDGRQVNEAVIATYWSHLRVVKKIRQSGGSALVLEDDVDIEWDVERMWSRIHQRIPDDWDLSFLGHCWGNELIKPARLHPSLHPATSPLCLHGYALTAKGATKFDALLSDPWTAYQTAVDTVVPTVINSRLIEAYSVDPPLIIQRKDDRSDIREDTERDTWRGLLADSTVDRIIRDEKGEEAFRALERERESRVGVDPATRWEFRCGARAD